MHGIAASVTPERTSRHLKAGQLHSYHILPEQNMCKIQISVADNH